LECGGTGGLADDERDSGEERAQLAKPTGFLRVERVDVLEDLDHHEEGVSSGKQIEARRPDAGGVRDEEAGALEKGTEPFDCPLSRALPGSGCAHPLLMLGRLLYKRPRRLSSEEPDRSGLDPARAKRSNGPPRSASGDGPLAGPGAG